MANFVSKFPNFRYHGNKRRSLLNFNDAVQLRVLESPLLGAKFFGMCHINRVIANFVLKILKFDKGPSISSNLLKKSLLVTIRRSYVPNLVTSQSCLQTLNIGDQTGQVILYSVQCCYV